MKRPHQQSPIFVKTYDFLLWLIPLTLKFPRSQRFLLAERLSKMALDFYDAILEAVMEPGRQDVFLKGQVRQVQGCGASAERERSRSVPG